MFSRGIYIVNLSTNERVPIMMVPRETSVEPKSSYAAIPSIGRNNPFYHFTGAERELSFEISWYNVEENREDVIRACKTLEAWSMADGEESGPPDIMIVYGNLFKGSIWKIQAAPYRLSLWTRPSRGQMLPTLAYQTLNLIQISNTNTRHDYIRQVNT